MTPNRTLHIAALSLMVLWPLSPAAAETPATAAVAPVAIAAPTAPPARCATTFSRGSAGWKGPQGIGGATFVDDTVGRPAPSLRTQFEDFGITFRRDKDAACVRALAARGPVAVGLGVKTFELTFTGAKVSRDLAIELRDYDNPPEGYLYVSVWALIGTLDSRIPGWQRLSVVIEDATATELPPGWGGYGAEDPDTFMPILPPGRTFANVIAGADEIAFTTLIPGFFYGFTYFDVAVDDIFIRPALLR